MNLLLLKNYSAISLFSRAWRLINIMAATTPTATIRIIKVASALISGVTPMRTLE